MENRNRKKRDEAAIRREELNELRKMVLEFRDYNFPQVKGTEHVENPPEQKAIIAKFAELEKKYPESVHLRQIMTTYAKVLEVHQRKMNRQPTSKTLERTKYRRMPR